MMTWLVTAELQPMMGALNISRRFVTSCSTNSIKRLAMQPSPSIGIARQIQTSACFPTRIAKVHQSRPQFHSKINSPILRKLSSTSSLRTDAAQIIAEQETNKSSQEEKTTSSPSVAYHLFFCAGLVYLIIVVGGLTRLTESGLSITEWNPGFKGMRLPWTDAEWEEEWEKYKRTPEWAILNSHMTVDDFKKIYMWEWSHRIIGRFIGVAFVLPAGYFLLRGKVARGTRWKLFAIALGIGFQGALGWFMVKSGLEAPEETPPSIAPQHPNSTVKAGLKDTRLDGSVSQGSQPSTSSDWHPRVSHFRLAAHLGTAFLVYMGMVHTGMAVLRDYKMVHGKGKAAGWLMNAQENVQRLVSAMQDSRVGRFKNSSRALLCLTFVTAMSGALVAGLDAGLIYGMPFHVPPKEELLEEKYSWRGDSKDINGEARMVIGNVTQNPVTVQFVHRCLALTTFVSALGLTLYSRRLSRSMGFSGFSKVTLPPAIPGLATLVSLTAVAQASLGIFTLIYVVPIELASAHQAGSVALLTTITALLAVLRKPNSRILQSLARSSQYRQATVARALNKVMIKSTN